jgi:dTDP-4-dehydrorhamnose reductase
MAVLGAGGQLGTAFRSVYPGARFVDRSGLDLADTGAIADRLAGLSPTAIVNCAAYTAVDRAEDEEELAHRVNGQAVGSLARFAADAGIPLVTYSTDYVFPGDATVPYVESDRTDPVNAYGRSKLAGEEAALAIHSGALVIRTSWVVSGTHPNFVATMLRLARRGEPWRVVDDQVGCPTVADDLAAGTAEAVDTGITGILHMTNAGATTWFELARAAIELAGHDPGLVEPCATADYPTPARRPAYSVLGSERAGPAGLSALPRWRDSLRNVVSALERSTGG